MGIIINGQNDTIGPVDNSMSLLGTVSIGGTMTIEDFTNIDSVGLITARSGLDVTGGTVNITTGTNSASPAGSGDNLVIKDSNGCGISILSGDGNSQNIYLGSTSDNDGVRLEGFYNSGNPYFNIYTGGSQRFLISSTGKIGIDNTTPHRQLVVGNGGDISCFGANGGIYFGTSTGGFRNNGAIARAQQAGYHVSGSQVGDLVMAPEADKALIFSSGSTNTMYERLRLTTGGNIGINDSGPNFHLDVNGNIAIREGQVLTWHDGSGNKAGDVYMDSSDNFVIRSTSSVAERLRITSTGDVGINCTPHSNAGINLHIHGDNTTSEIRLTNTTTGTGANGSYIQQGGNTLYIGNSESGSTVFEVNGSERLRITSAGKIGIGHAYGSQITKELTIRPVNDGGIRFVRPGDNAGSPNVHLDLTTTTSGSVFPSGEAYTVKYNTYNNDQIFTTYVGGGTGGNISFRTATQGNTPAERLRIASNGEVNIGGNYTQTSAPLCVTTSANDFGIRLMSGSNTVFDIINNDAAGNAEVRGYYNNNSGTRAEGFRLEASGNSYFLGGNFGIGESSPLGKLHVKTADSGASSVGASADELVIEGSGHAGMTILSGTDQQGIINFADPSDVNVGGFTYTHSDNSMVFRVNDAEKLRITSSGAHNLSSPSSSVAAGLLNVPNGSRLSSGVTPRGTYATGNGGIVDMARYEMISMCITAFPAYNNAICAINGAPLYINDTRDTWDRYYALPNYLLGTLTHDCINNSSFTFTLACTMTVFMGRSSTWNAVNTSGWNLIESNTSIGPFSSNTRLYVKTLAAGTHTLDNDSAMYFFSL